MENMELRAQKIATEAHQNQRRKWGKQLPYITHPQAVVEILKQLKNIDEIDICAAWLHDVIEDIAIPQEKLDEYKQLIVKECNQDVLNLVLELTNPTEGPEWLGISRKVKRAADWAHLATVSDRAKRIKMADRLHNLSGGKDMPIKLLRKYLEESRVLLGLCGSTDQNLANLLKNAIKEFEAYAEEVDI